MAGSQRQPFDCLKVSVLQSYGSSYQFRCETTKGVAIWVLIEGRGDKSDGGADLSRQHFDARLNSIAELSHVAVVQTFVLAKHVNPGSKLTLGLEVEEISDPTAAAGNKKFRLEIASLSGL